MNPHDLSVSAGLGFHRERERESERVGESTSVSYHLTGFGVWGCIKGELPHLS